MRIRCFMDMAPLRFPENGILTPACTSPPLMMPHLFKPRGFCFRNSRYRRPIM